MPEPELKRFSDLEALSRAACAEVVVRAAQAVAARGRFCLVLAGGKTPRRLYELLAESAVDWAKTHLFWGDERCVPKDDPASNFRLARETLLARAAVPPQNVHAMPGELGSPAAGAKAYEEDLRGFFRGWPVFDLILLGMGSDGHTASLFPGEAALEERDRMVLAVDGRRADPPVPRLTLTLPALNASRTALFLASGKEKEAMLLRAVSGDRALPSGRVWPREHLLWYFAD